MPHARRRRMVLARSLFAASALSVLVVACGGKSLANDDLLTTPEPTDPTHPKPAADAGPDAPVKCNGANLACDSDDVSVGSEANCGKADYCYSRTGCAGATLWCAHYGTTQCGAVPSCDKGDVEVTGCPGGPPGPGNDVCYPRSVCGSTIFCLHHDACTALPSCNPGDQEVTDIATCSMHGINCYAVTECNYTIHCYTPSPFAPP